MKFPSIVWLFVITTLFAGAQTNVQGLKESGGGKKPDDNCGILYGRNHALSFCAPDGWILDNGILNDQGIYAVFYPKGSNWDQAKKFKSFMYFNVVDMASKDTVKSRMDADAKEELQSSPDTKVKTATEIRIGNRAVPALEFSLGGNSGHEEVAYVGEEKVLVMIVLSSKDGEIFKQDYPFFEKLVQSYKFLTSDVQIEHK